MVNIHSFLPSLNDEPLSIDENPELNRRLGLYQVFLKLYDHHRGLLDEILNLENSGSKLIGNASLPYVQGSIIHKQVYLITNILRGKTQAFIQPQNIWTIGRDSRQVVLPIQDSRLSRCHAAIRYVENRGFQLLDLGSSNGSFVNGESIKHTTWIKDGDRIRLGSLTFTFSVCQQAQTLSTLSSELLTQIQEIERLSLETEKCSLKRVPEPIPSLPIGKNSTQQGLEDTLLFMHDRSGKRTNL